MPDYSKGKIYCIRSFQTDKVYIGSTTQTLAQRLGTHREDYKRYLRGNKHYVSSFKLLKYDDYYIELITLYPCSCKAELVAEEGKFIRELDCVNKNIAGRTSRQYHIDNRDKIKQWHIDNRDKKKEYDKQYYIDNIEKIKKYKNKEIKLVCACGVELLNGSCNIKRHLKSKKHKKFMSNLINNFI